MTPILLSAIAAVSFAPPVDRPTDAQPSLDGSWTVLCFEKDGQAVPQAKKTAVTIKDNVATFTPAGEDQKQKSMKLAFGPQATIRVTELDATSTAPAADQKATGGVYVLTNEFLAICLHDEAAGSGARTDAASEKPITKSKCTVILQRAATGDRR